jgi:hypothetical protein
MADIRIKDLATTATTTASDDFMAVDGSINGTRKMNAATPAFLTSVTTPSLTSPAASPLTLGTGTFGTALTVASATGNVSIASTTAGSAGAGALVVTGGLSAGGASYFGGSVSFPSDKGVISSVNDGRLFLDGSANQNGGGIILYGSAHGSFPARISYNGNTHVFQTVSGTQQLSLSLTAATFAGAVTVTGALKLGNAYVGTPVVGTGYIVIQDSNGTNYKVSVAAL